MPRHVENALAAMTAEEFYTKQQWDWYYSEVDLSPLQEMDKQELIKLISLLNKEMIRGTENWEGG